MQGLSSQLEVWSLPWPTFDLQVTLWVPPCHQDPHPKHVAGTGLVFTSDLHLGEKNRLCPLTPLPISCVPERRAVMFPSPAAVLPKHWKPAESWAGAETSSARPGSPGLPPPPRQGQPCCSEYCSTPSSKLLLLSLELTHEMIHGAFAEPSKMQLSPLCQGWCQGRCQGLCRVHGALLPPPPPQELRRYTPTGEDGKGPRDLQGQRRAVHREGLEQEGAPGRAGIWAGTGARAECTWGCGGPRVTTGGRGPSQRGGWSGSGVGRCSGYAEPHP